MNRRQLLAALAGGTAVLAGGKAIDNAVLGYGPVVGTNLLEQDLGPLVLDGVDPSPFEVALGGSTLAFTGEAIRATEGDRSETLELSSTTPERAAEVDARFGLRERPLEGLVRDLPAIERGEVDVEFASYRAFFDRLDDAEPRPFAVEALRDRRWMGVEPNTIESFAGASAADPRAVVVGLAAAFREHTAYDVPRYVAGSIDDNVLGGAADLREPFRSPTGFDAIQRGEDTGLFCWEFTHRSMEALQAIPPHRQDPPVFAREVYDRRHGHVYTAIGSAHRDGDALTLLLTFVDYSRSTWYDNFGLRWLFGEGVNAYDSRHRATRIG